LRTVERSRSPWKASAPLRGFLPLERDEAADVCVVGAGIAGLSVAYELAREGLRPIVLEGRVVGAGETAQSTAHVATSSDDGLERIEELHGARGAQLVAQSFRAALERLVEIADVERIECDLAHVDGWLTLSPGAGPERLERELSAARRAGVEGVELCARAPLASFGEGPALRYAGQVRFHPLRYLDGLAGAVERHGGRIFTGARVSELNGGESPWVETSDGRRVHARALVVATNAPLGDRLALSARLEPRRTYVIAAALTGAVSDALYWDTAQPYHYARLQPDGSGEQGGWLLLTGGEDHRTGEEGARPDVAARFRRLEAWSRERFPIGRTRFRWSGQVYEPVDGVAFIGRSPLLAGKVFVATGDSGQGITHGVLAGLLLRDLVLGRANEWAGLYDPRRLPLRSAPELARANLDVARHYADHLLAEPAPAADPAPGEGLVLRRGGKLVAIARDENGAIRELSAVCPHLGCVVHWNAAERSWDCPCHGSRFAATGELLTGPARSPLERLSPLR
jgi:glycine/D-amino acid oxidase-like deaminating enzyme/nitrite reductase/ring-hydroxylating ferredoxin subunit